MSKQSKQPALIKFIIADYEQQQSYLTAAIASTNKKLSDSNSSIASRILLESELDIIKTKYLANKEFINHLNSIKNV